MLIVVATESFRLKVPLPVNPLLVLMVTNPLPTDCAAVFAACDRISEACKPSNKSASRPVPVPSTVLIAVNNSEGVWSAVALSSIKSSFAPSVATSLPSTCPVTVMSPVTSIPLLKSTLLPKVSIGAI